MRAALPIALLGLIAAPALGADEVWTWTDEKGEEHFTNDKGAIPEQFRPRARSTAGSELSVVKTGQAPAPSDSKAAPIRVVFFGSSTNSASKTLERAGVVDKLVSSNPGLLLEKVEFSTAVERAERLKVTQLPSVLFLDSTGTVLGRTTGLVTLKELQQQLDKIKGGER